jgi:soluble lytic murein transglycosylase-like protein
MTLCCSWRFPEPPPRTTGSRSRDVTTGVKHSESRVFAVGGVIWARRCATPLLVLVSWFASTAASAEGLSTSAVATVVASTTGAKRSAFPRTESAYLPFFLEAARVYRIPLALLFAVGRVESNFNPAATSHVGAIGIMQLMPATAREMGVRRIRDPRENILGGARYLRVLANQWKGDLVRTIASYNAGPAAVERYRGVPPFRETQRYVRRVLEHCRRYSRGGQ